MRDRRGVSPVRRGGERPEANGQSVGDELRPFQGRAKGDVGGHGLRFASPVAIVVEALRAFGVFQDAPWFCSVAMGWLCSLWYPSQQIRPVSNLFTTSSLWGMTRTEKPHWPLWVQGIKPVKT